MKKIARSMLNEISDKLLTRYINKSIALQGYGKKDRSVGISKAMDKIMDREDPQTTARYRGQAKLYLADPKKMTRN